MTQYINKDVLVAEIKRQQRRLNILEQSNEIELRRDAAIQNGVYCSLLSFLNTLEVKEVDLNDETCKDLKYDGTCMYIANITGKTMRCEYIHCTRKIKSTERKII